jgi:hypothetical protein
VQILLHLIDKLKFMSACLYVCNLGTVGLVLARLSSFDYGPTKIKSVETCKCFIDLNYNLIFLIHCTFEVLLT